LVYYSEAVGLLTIYSQAKPAKPANVEAAKIPVFGFVYGRTAILVDRKSPESRKAVYDDANRRIKNGASICIFPEGGVPEGDVLLADFKKGAFHLAMHAQTDILPIAIVNAEDVWPEHSSLQLKPGKIELRIGQPISTKGLTKDRIDEICSLTHHTIENLLL